MIESCTKRRMIFGITFLGGLTLLVLIVESHWTSGSRNHIGVTGKNSTKETGCWLHEEYEIIEPCHPCSDYEITSGVCVLTRSKETVRCKKSGKTVFKSCEKVVWLEERNFWIFEGSMFMVGVISTVVVFYRQKMLDHQMLRRIQRQLASGVYLIGDSLATMDELYLQVFSEPVGGIVQVPLETLITLFNLKYCEYSPSCLVFVVQPDQKPSFNVKVTNLTYELVRELDIKNVAKMCQLPAIVVGDGNTSVAGLCAVLRQLVKNTIGTAPGHRCQSLLGFRQGCLMACAESSVWTRYCEVDIIKSVKKLMCMNGFSHSVTVPEDVARFEIHMGQPLRIHNIQKRNQDFVISRGGKIQTKPKKGTCNAVEENHISYLNNGKIEIDHIYAEGPTMTLADTILFPCMHIILQMIRSVYLQPYIPLTMQWCERMKLQEGIEESAGIIIDIPNKIEDELYIKYILPDIPKKSLYKSDPKRYKPKNRIFTRQEDVEASLKVAHDLGLVVEWQQFPFGYELEFDWGAVPYEAHPEGGHLPAVRLERKSQQLENLAKAVLKVAKPGHTIVDFCSGSGHLGIVLAYFLPRCHVILLENKEESLTRARQRVCKLKLTNVTFYQCNLDYFCGMFDIGVSLHACGVATDLVIQRCISQNAIFVCCPCCYGSVQNNHILTYPRSKFLRDSAMSLREYLVLGHSADQTHDENNAKTDQGKICMGIIDMDRCLQAREAGYEVCLSKLVPETCTPKNNLLIGIPKNWN